MTVGRERERDVGAICAAVRESVGAARSSVKPLLVSSRALKNNRVPVVLSTMAAVFDGGDSAILRTARGIGLNHVLSPSLQR